MRLQFDPGETIGENVARMLRGQLAKAERATTKRGLDAAGVHSARKAFKRARGVLRLVRTGLGKADYRDLNMQLRDLGRDLSEARDSHVLMQSLTSLAHHADIGRSVAVLDLKALIAERADGDGSLAKPNPKPAARAIDHLKAHVDALPLEDISFADVAAGYARTYAIGRSQYAEITSVSNDDAHHDLRKAVQYHWRQSAMLEPAWPDAMRLRLETARLVSRLLGADHDLSVLAEFIDGPGKAACRKSDRRRLIAAARQRQTELRQLFKSPARRLYALPPAALGDAIRAYWTAAGEERLVMHLLMHTDDPEGLGGPTDAAPPRNPPQGHSDPSA
ncbi:MAG: CHAD domain-containing protein [Pseudomonadota bacterium]